MKSIFVPALLFFFSSIAFSQSTGDPNKINNDIALIKQSNIKQKTIWEYRYSHENEQTFRDSGYKAFNYYYDNGGRVTEWTKYHIFSNLTVKEVFRYGKTDKIAGVTRFNSSGNTIETIDYKYNSAGKLKKEVHTAYFNEIKPDVYFTIIASISDDTIFSTLQDDLQIEPKLGSYTITVNITDPEELNQYVVIGDESDVTSPRYPWSQLTMESQRGLLAYKGPNKKQHAYITKFISNVNYKYDKNYNLVEKSIYTTSNDLLEKETYRYDANNNKTGYSKYNESGKLTGSENYTYDAANKLIESTGLESDGRIASKLQYKYNENGNLIEKIWLNSAGEIVGEYKYTYDNENRLSEELKFRGESEKESRQVYKYDVNGNVLEIIRHDANDKKDKLTKYFYEVW